MYQKSVKEMMYNEHKLYKIESLDQFSRIDKLQLGKSKVQDISKQLELQLTAKLAHLERMKDKEEFAKFTFNPFHIA